MSKTIARIVISCVALIIILVRHLLPQISIDPVDVILFIVLVVPWLSNLIKELEVLGIGKISFQDVKSVEDKIGTAITKTTPKKSSMIETSVDANLLFVELRIEIEKRLRVLAHQYNLNKNISLHEMVLTLSHNKVIVSDIGYALLDLIHIGNQAAHGAKVEMKAALWVRDTGPFLLRYLDKKIKKPRAR